MDNRELLAQLNPGQRAAVEYCDGPSLVIAGAGSGKTRVLTYKIAYLINLGMKPWNILALTFTNKAANEMKLRIGSLVGADNARHIVMGTFHSVLSRMLRREAESLGFTPQFTIYDEADSRSLLKAIVKEMNLDDKTYRPAAVHNRISLAKNHIIDAWHYQNDGDIYERDRQSRMPAVGKIYALYQQRLRSANAMDFDDLLVNAYALFRRHDDIRRSWAERFHFILVDEYQDTNRVQQSIVEQLGRERHRVCVVGDDAQSIYAFRGASIDNMLQFSDVYPDMKLFKLERNYRSTQRIVGAANSLIRHNERQIRKDVFSENEEGEPLVLRSAYSDTEEAAIVCNEIRRMRAAEDLEYSDFAILYRTNAQSRSFEEQCRKQGIPYRIYGGLSFYQRKEIKDIIAYFRLVSNNDDEEAFKRVVNYPARGIGDTTVGRIAEAAQKHGVSFWEIAREPERWDLQANAATRAKLRKFTEMISAFTRKLDTVDAYELGKEIIRQSGISAELYASKDMEDVARQENLEEFMAALQDFVEGMREEGREQYATLPEFLQEVSLQTDKESEDGSEAKVSMMTVHSAKGLEFPTVFIVGMEENLFPSQMSLSSPRELEEERRLLYVAITRAGKHCILTCCKCRWRYGRTEFQVPSRFLREIDAKYIKVEAVETEPRRILEPKPFAPWQGSNVQNSRPVATQFRADTMRKITAPRSSEPEAEVFMPAFRQKLDEARRRSETRLGEGANTSDSAHGRDATSAPDLNVTEATDHNHNGLREGTVIEHQRFGIGTVVKLEGSGEATKATVDFRNTGRKQLLLKFAKITVVR